MAIKTRGRGRGVKKARVEAQSVEAGDTEKLPDVLKRRRQLFHRPRPVPAMQAR